jgi:small subunit ribosomal protein S6
MQQPYEVMVMFGPEVEEPRQDEVVARVRQIAEGAGGHFEADDAWGRRKLAYEIAHQGEGVYHVLTFTTTAEALDEISRVLRISDDVLRHMAVRRTGRSSGPVEEQVPVS